MKILSHRGLWRQPPEKNTLGAFSASLAAGFGFESDVRDYAGGLVISHEMADASSPSLAAVLELLRAHGDEYCFAVNIKADGVIKPLGELLRAHGVDNYFTFDMSVPQMIEYRAAGLRFFTRQSEFETAPCLYGDAAGVWMDAFFDETWLTPPLVEEHLGNGKTVCLVSADLHQRDPLPLWETVKAAGLSGAEKLYLCTDRPEQAKAFFKI